MADHFRMRRKLAGSLPAPVWPAGIAPVAFASAPAVAVHDVIASALPTPPFAEWWPWLTQDGEYDPALVFVAANGDGAPVGVAQCWTSGFVKDLAVLPGQRGRGIGEALLLTAFAAFRDRGFSNVDLKVVSSNALAIRLYRRLGMVEAPL